MYLSMRCTERDRYSRLVCGVHVGLSRFCRDHERLMKGRCSSRKGETGICRAEL